MSFKKRNVGLTGTSLPSAYSKANPGDLSALAPQVRNTPGVRPSPLDGRSTTSTGTQSLDDLLAGHAGLVLGNSILIEEGGTTDYAGILLRYYAAEGVLQGHRIHVVGVGEQWRKDLPGPVNSAVSRENDSHSKVMDKEKMKIAWRYEGLGEFGALASNPRAVFIHDLTKKVAPISLSRSAQISKGSQEELPNPNVFCHNFDLTQRLTISAPNIFNFIPVYFGDGHASPFHAIIESLDRQLTSSTATIHRVIIPALLSPALYPPYASNPQHVLQFLQSLRFLLRQHSARLTAMITLPLSLYPRSSGLVRWIEILSDGVLELASFPYKIDSSSSSTTLGAATAQEEKPQGMVKIHRLPVFHEIGGGGSRNEGVSDDLAFTVSRKKFEIKPFSLPPVEGDSEAQRGDSDRKAKSVNLDF